ncbi:MAG: 50S ribosomal protein L4 [Patescibacteria group bacterium]
MKINVYNQKGEKKEDLTVSKIFDVEVGSKAATLYINYLRSALRFPVANTKNRGEVSGGGKKPWKQKGTGNARAGSSRSPLWVGGGVTFGPNNDQNFHKRINSREKRRVILGLIGELVRDKKVSVLEDYKADAPKTKEAATLLTNLKAEGKVSVILSKENGNANLAFRNIAGVKVMSPSKLDMIYLTTSDSVVVSKSAMAQLEEIFSAKDKKAE